MSKDTIQTRNAGNTQTMEQDEPSENDQDCDSEESTSAVRRPMNAFFIFCKRHRDIVREKYPHLENRSITKILGEWWANLEPYEKTSYTSLAKQYKEAFMRAHPDFKWYKLPAPSVRTLVTRPSNSRLNQNQNEKNGLRSSNCGITLGKLVDDEHLGGLSSLINTPMSSAALVPSNSFHNSSMAQKTAKSILKPPKKRYLVNGEFKCNSDVLPNENDDYPSRSACSALLEFAEICTSNAVRENASASLNANCGVHDSETLNSQVTANKFIPLSSESNDHSLPGSFTYPVLCSMQKSKEKHNLFSSSDVNSSTIRTNSTSDQQEQPLDLCKNKAKTITASHQQLIDHFVDKFLCDTPVPQNSYYKSSIIDPTFCKILSDKYASDSSSSKGEKLNRSFTLAVAIESAVDKAYSMDSSKSHKTNIPDNTIFEHITHNNCDFNFHFKADSKSSAKSQSSDANVTKTDEQPFDNLKVSAKKDMKYIADSNYTDITNKNSVKSQIKLSKFENKANDNSNSSPFYCKMMSPPKKSRLWCDIFMNEQLSKNDGTESKSDGTDSLVSELSYPIRRSSQRTCKGRRYQALITEGILQSPKERKNNTNKRAGFVLDKGKQKVNEVFEKNLASGPKKKRKKYDKNKGVKNDYPEFDKSLFNIEEKIASLPKCDFEHMDRKKTLETTSDKVEAESINPSTSTSSENICTSSSEMNEWTTVSSNECYRTGCVLFFQEL